MNTTSPTLALLTAALAPTEAILRDEYKRQLTDRKVKLLAELAEDGWDSEKRYGYPDSNGYPSRKAWAQQKRRYELCSLYTEGVKASRSFHEPNIRRQRADNAARIAKRADAMAKQALAGYCAKLAVKIDALGQDVVTVKYFGGTNPWGWTHILVNGGMDGAQIWRTRMIVNISVLGNPYNQWPTRRVLSMESGE